MSAKQVVMIMVDTERQDMLGCYDEGSAPTPNLDKLAKEGMVYDNAFTCQPVCGPARSALFTGLYPHSNGMIANCMQLGANIKNAGQWLTPQGVKCGYVGKWHLDGGDYFGYGKCPDGYMPEYWYDMRNFLEEFSDEDRMLSRKHMNCRFDDPKEEDTYAHRCVDRAIKFVENYKDEDFYLTLSLDEPHDPSICPRRFINLLKDTHFKIKKTPNVRAKLDGKPEHQKVWARQFKKLRFWMIRRSMRALYACNSYCDYEIGRLLDKIDELGIKPLIIHTSDHGDMLLSHGLHGKGCVMYNEITKIPLIIKNSDAGVGRESTPVSHVDLLPTIITYLGRKVPAMLQGAPIQEMQHNTTRDVFMEFTRYEVDHDGFMGYQPIRCITNGEYKLVINLLTSDEFYDLKNDKYEKVNLINTTDKELMKIRDDMHDRLLNMMNVTRDVYRGYYWACRPWRPSKKPNYNNDGFTRQLIDEDFVQLDYNTGLPMKGGTRKKK